MNPKTLKQGKWVKRVPIQYIGKDFKIHTVFRKRKLVFGKLKDQGILLPTAVTSNPRSGGKTLYPRGHYPQRRHGVMHDNIVIIPGVRKITSGNNNGTGTTVVTQIKTAHRDILSNVLSVSGDHKRPNNQRFTHQAQVFYNGYHRVIDVSTYSYSEGWEVAPWPGPPAWSGFPDATTYNKALSRVYDKLRGDIDLSIDLAEAHKSKAMIMQTVKGMRNLATTFRKMKRSNPRDWGNLWLEYTYGWRPLAKSIFGTAEKLIVGTGNGPRLWDITATAQQWTDVKTTDAQGSFGTWSNLRTVTQKQNRCKFVVRFVMKNTALDQLAGFTSLNPVSLVWELTPYSFVVDWFVNIGGYLRDFENSLLYHTNFHSGYVVETSKGTVLRRITGSDYNATTRTTSTVNLQGSEVVTEKKRTVLSSIPYPRVPRFDPQLGASRLLSGAALLGQMLKSLEHPKEKVSFHTAETKFFDWATETQRNLQSESRLRRRK